MRNATWESFGVKAEGNDLDNLLKAADLDYNAVARDLYVNVEGTEILVPEKKMIMREDTNQMFGIVSDRYQICQNRDALDFVRYIGDISLVKAGSTSYGGAYLIGSLPEVNIMGDTIRPNLIFQNSHDGSSSIKATICMLRLVCQNQFVSAFKNSPATIRISHLGDMENKLELARDTLISVNDYLENFESEATELATQKITPFVFNKILDEFFQKKEEYSDRKNEKIEHDRELFMKAYNEEDNQNFQGTRWGMINAYSDYLTHYEPLRKTENWEEQRFIWTMNPKYMQLFLDMVKHAA